jgi:hypothetical protein
MNNELHAKNILTIATGKKIYVDLAINLARSFHKWNENSGISFLIATDLPQLIPADIAHFSQIIKIDPDQFGRGFSPKLHLDQLAPIGQTLFIDSDCLIFGDISFIFERFKGKAVSVLGGYIRDGEWFGDIGQICRKFNITKIPKFNGGIYYIENGETAKRVYAKARDLEKQYDEIGFKRLRNLPNDEVVMALSMELNEMTPVFDDGKVMSDPQACPGGYKIDLIKGKCYLINPPYPHPKHQLWYPFEKVEPVIFHFLGYYTQHYPYQREIRRLQQFTAKKLNVFTEASIRVKVEYPQRILSLLKDIFRPLFRMMFGIRHIKTSERI